MNTPHSQFDGFVELKAPKKIYLQDTAGNAWAYKGMWIITNKDRIVYDRSFSGAGILYTDLIIRSQWLIDKSSGGSSICDIFTTEEDAWAVRHHFYVKHGQGANDVLYWNMMGENNPIGIPNKLIRSEPLFED
jgi:hypothetical protein